VGETTGRIRGFVKDYNNVPVKEAQLQLKSSRLLRPETQKVRQDGSYVFDNLPPGEDYELSVQAPGFEPLKQKEIRVRLGQTTAVEDLQLAELSEVIVVSAPKVIIKAHPVINPDTAQTGSVVTAEKAAATPIFNQVEGMTQLAPGV